MEFKLQNYNEFKGKVRWHDYASLVVNEFPFLLVRRYDWLDSRDSTFMVQVFGVKVYQRIYKWSKK